MSDCCIRFKALNHLISVATVSSITEKDILDHHGCEESGHTGGGRME